MKVKIIVSIISLVLGVIIGELLDLDGKLNDFANFIKKFISGEENKFSEGFISASLIFCVGSMAILGSIDAGLKGDNKILFAKATMDAFTAFSSPWLSARACLYLPFQFLSIRDFSFHLRLFGASIDTRNSCKFVGHWRHYDYFHLPFHVKTCWLQTCKFTSSNFCPIIYGVILKIF